MFKKTKILPVVRLKHLELIAQDEVEYAKTMQEISGYKNNWFRRKSRFLKAFAANFVLVKQVRDVDIMKLEESEDCKLKRPINIDFVCFQAMMELQAILGSEDDGILSLKIAKVIAAATFESNNKIDYTSEGEDFNNYVDRILNYDLLHMMGLFNWITKSLEESAQMWNERFASVHIDDEDYEFAAGNRMAQFNIINTIKGICSEYNVPFKEAWLMSYNLVQTSSYSSATASKIQDDLRMVKEAKLKTQRNN